MTDENLSDIVGTPEIPTVPMTDELREAIKTAEDSATVLEEASGLTTNAALAEEFTKAAEAYNDIARRCMKVFLDAENLFQDAAELSVNLAGIFTKMAETPNGD